MLSTVVLALALGQHCGLCKYQRCSLVHKCGLCERKCWALREYACGARVYNNATVPCADHTGATVRVRPRQSVIYPSYTPSTLLMLTYSANVPVDKQPHIFLPSLATRQKGR